MLHHYSAGQMKTPTLGGRVHFYHTCLLMPKSALQLVLRKRVYRYCIKKRHQKAPVPLDQIYMLLAHSGTSPWPRIRNNERQFLRPLDEKDYIPVLLPLSGIICPQATGKVATYSPSTVMPCSTIALFCRGFRFA